MISSKMEFIDHDTTINYCELIGIKMVLNSLHKYISFCDEYKMVTSCKFINIYTDSKFVCDILDIAGYPKYDYYYELIRDFYFV